MFKKKIKTLKEIEENSLKQLKMFEKVYGQYSEIGHSVYYVRIPGGLIRTVANTEAIDQLFIPLPNTYFIG